MLKDGDRLLICVSGEKDSMALLSLLTLCLTANDLSVEVIVLTIDEGISDYRTKCVDVVRQYCLQNGLTHIIRSYKESFKASLDEALSNRGPSGLKICSICCQSRAFVVQDVRAEMNCNVIASGLNLSDIASYAIMSIVQGAMDDKCHPVVVNKGWIHIAPLSRLLPKECWLYAYLKGVSFMNEDCPNSAEHFSDLLKYAVAGLEDNSPGVMELLASGYYNMSKGNVS